MTVSEWLSIGAGIAAVGGPLVTWGMVRQQVIDLKAQVGKLATKESVEAIEAHVGNLASQDSVRAVEGRVGELETDMREVHDDLKSIPVIAEKVNSLQNIVSIQFDQVNQGLRDLKQGVLPLPNRARGRPATN